MAVPAISSRRDELLERAYRYVLHHGMVGMSLRPLAAAIDSSPRVLLFLFGSKDELVRALLARARADELQLVDRLRQSTGDNHAGLHAVAAQLWSWLAAAHHRPLLKFWVEGYARSLVDSDGPWSGFARATVHDWLEILAAAQPPRERATLQGEAERTLVLTVLRGALLDLLATDDTDRTTAAVHQHLEALRGRKRRSSHRAKDEKR